MLSDTAVSIVPGVPLARVCSGVSRSSPPADTGLNRSSNDEGGGHGGSAKRSPHRRVAAYSEKDTRSAASSKVNLTLVERSTDHHRVGPQLDQRIQVID